MIFFVDKSDKYHAWWEIYDSYGAFKAAILEAIKADNVCQSILENYQCYFGIEPTVLFAEALDKTLFFWTHYNNGNILNSPAPRPSEQLDTWSTHLKINKQKPDKDNPVTLAVYGEEVKIKYSEVQVNRRDMCLFYRINNQASISHEELTPLARALTGELTSKPNKMLEKVLSAYVCKSKSLEICLGQALRKYIELYNAKNPLATSGRVEYTAWYLPGYYGEDYNVHASRLIELAKYELSESTSKLKLDEAWNSIPKVMRLIMVMNDIRAIYKDKRKEPNKKPRFVYPINIASQGERYPYLNSSFDKDHINLELPETSKTFKVNRKLGMHWSWVRDEQADSVINYRQNLLSLWAGPSGHAMGNCHFWRAIYEGKVEEQNKLTVAIIVSLAAFWRLFYDRRVSGSHTMTETYETSLAYQQPNHKTTPSRMKPFDRSKDAFSQILGFAIANNGVLDPALILDSVYASGLAKLAKTPSSLVEAIKRDFIIAAHGQSMPAFSKSATSKGEAGLKVKGLNQSYERKPVIWKMSDTVKDSTHQLSDKKDVDNWIQFYASLFGDDEKVELQKQQQLQQLEQKLSLIPQQQDDENAQNADHSHQAQEFIYADSGSSKSKKDKKTSLSELFVLTPNAGGGDCLLHALRNKDLNYDEVIQLRGDIADKITSYNGKNWISGSVVFLALFQSGFLTPELQQALYKKNQINIAIFQDMVKIPGLYAGEEEIQAFCKLTQVEDFAVVIVTSNGELRTVNKNGSQAVLTLTDENEEAFKQRVQTYLDLEKDGVKAMVLFKTDVHWARITSIK